jgi:hypothetical protein
VRDNAANAKTAVDGMSSDLIFSSAEKATYRLQWEGMQANYFNIIAQATTYGIQAETAFTDFTTARNNLSTYLFTTQNIDAGIATAITGDLLAVYTQAFYEKMTLAVNRLTNTNSSIDLDAVTGMKVIRVKQPVGAVMSMSGNPITGAIIVTLPVGWSANMVRFAIDVYNYGGSKSFTLNVSGYTYPGSGAGGYWVNTTADIVGNLASDNRVRFMYNNVTNKAVIVIGSVTADGTASSWTHPSASVRDLHVSWNGGPTTIAQWESGWGIHISDSLTDYPLRPAANPDYSDALLDAANLKGEGPLAKSDLTEAQVTNANLVLNSNGTLSGGSVSSAAINALNLLNGPAHAGATLGSTVAQLSGSFDQVKWDSVLGSAKIKTAQIELLNVTNALLAADISADKITAGTVTGRTIQTDVSPNKRMEMSSTTDHLRFYTDATTVYAEIGYKLDGTDYVVGDFGNTSAANAAVGIRARSYNKHAISAYSLNGYAGVFQSATGDGISVTGAEIGARFTSTARQGIISQSGLDDGIWGVALTVGKVGVYGNGPGAGVGGFSSEVGVKGVSAKIGAYGYSTGVAGIGLKAENVAATGTSLQIVPDVSSDTPYASSPAGSVHIPNNQNYATLKLNGVNRRLATDVITCRLNSTGTSLVGTTGQLVGFGYARYGLGIYYIEVPGWGADFTISIQVSRNTYAYPVVSYRNPTTGYFEFKLFDPVTGGGVDCNTEITLVRD